MDHTSKRKLISNSSWQILFSILRSLIGFLTTAYVAKQLGPKDFGELQYIFSIHYILQLSELFSHHSIVKKLLLENPKSFDEIMGSSFILNLGITLATFTTSSIIALKLYEDPNLALVFILGQIGLIARPFNNISFYFDSILESKKASFSHFLGNFFSNISRFCAIWLTKSLLIQAVLFSLQFFIASFFNVILYLKEPSKSLWKWKFNFSISKQLTKESLPLLLAALSAIIFLKIDIIMLENMMNATAVGIYSVAVKLSEPWFFFCSAIITSFFPSVIQIKSRTIRGYYYKLTRLNSIIFTLGLSISIFMSLTAKYWISFLFGNEFIGAIPVLQVHIWGITFLFWENLQHLWEVKENYLRFALVKSVFTSILNIILNYFLIPHLGIMGAAYATVISYLTAGFLFNFTTKKSRFYLTLQLKSVLIFKYLSASELKEVLLNRK